MKWIVNSMTNMLIYSLFKLEGVSLNTRTNDQYISRLTKTNHSPDKYKFKLIVNTINFKIKT